MPKIAERLSDEGDKGVSLDACGLALLVTGADAGAVTSDLGVADNVGATHND